MIDIEAARKTELYQRAIEKLEDERDDLEVSLAEAILKDRTGCVNVCLAGLEINSICGRRLKKALDRIVIEDPELKSHL